MASSVDFGCEDEPIPYCKAQQDFHDWCMSDKDPSDVATKQHESQRNLLDWSEIDAEPLEVVTKRYVSPEEVQTLGLTLGLAILKSIDEFRPDFIIVLWRGGAPFGMVVQGFLKSKGIVTDHIAVRTESYTAPGEQNAKVAVYGLNRVIDKCNRNDRVLIVDDVFESGRSAQAVVDKMRLKMRENMPQDVRFAVGFWKPNKNKTSIRPHFVGAITYDWLVFSHEFEDLTEEEVLKFMGEKIHKMIYGVRRVVGVTETRRSCGEQTIIGDLSVVQQVGTDTYVLESAIGGIAVKEETTATPLD